MLQKYGFNVIYLGANVPLNCVSEITKKKKIDNILYFSISNLSKKDLPQTVQRLGTDCNKIPQKIVTNYKNTSISDSTTQIINNLDNFMSIINN